MGQTKDLSERLKRHKNGQVRSTKFRRPLDCIYTEECSTRAEAFAREEYYKSLWSARFKKKLKQHTSKSYHCR